MAIKRPIKIDKTKKIYNHLDKMEALATVYKLALPIAQGKITGFRVCDRDINVH